MGANSSYTSTNASGAAGDTTITVIYTMNSPTASATSGPITVHKPTSVVGGAVTDNGTQPCTLACLATPNQGNCNVTKNTSCTYSANQFQREYKVYDQFGTFFQNFGVIAATVTEQVSITSNNCGSGVETGSEASADFLDNYGKCDSCCESGGPGCTTQAAQTISVNGYSIFSTTITETCTTATAKP